MRGFVELEQYLDTPQAGLSSAERATGYLQAGEEILEQWIIAHGNDPTADKKEDFRILALQRQGSKGDPSFNACRETCRELVFHYNLVQQKNAGENVDDILNMMELVAKHLVLFVGGKMQNAELGEFCCSSKSLRLNPNDINAVTGVNDA